MSEKAADDNANPIILAILFAGILATLVFILMTGDYGESEVPEQTTAITPVDQCERIYRLGPVCEQDFRFHFEFRHERAEGELRKLVGRSHLRR